MPSNNVFVYLDLTIDSKAVGRLVLELFTALAPRTCENFRRLCTGESGVFQDMQTDVPLHFINTIFHKLIPGRYLEGGDLHHKQGLGGWSIYGKYFNDEALSGKFDEEGVLAMASHAANKNASKFMITIGPTPEFEGKRVAFGRVAFGLEVLRKIAQVGADSGDIPLKKIKIIDCGEMDDKKLFLNKDPLGTEGMKRIRDANKYRRLFFDVEKEELDENSPKSADAQNTKIPDRQKFSEMEGLPSETIKNIISDLRQQIEAKIYPQRPEENPDLKSEGHQYLPHQQKILENYRAEPTPQIAAPGQPADKEKNSQRLEDIKRKISAKRNLNTEMVAQETAEPTDGLLKKREKMESVGHEKSKVFENLKAKNISEHPYLNDAANAISGPKPDLYSILKKDEPSKDFGWQGRLISF